MSPNEFIAARKELGLTQQELASLLGFTPDHVSRIERGAVALTKTTELAISYLFLTKKPH